MSSYALALFGFLSLSLLCAAPNSSRLDAARKTIEADPKSPQAYIELASLLCRHARDSENLAEYDEATKALDRALELSPGNFEALKLNVLVLLGRHDFINALKQAQALNPKVRDDITVWGYLVDANMALGEYEEAEKDAQWILDLRRGSTLGFIKAAALREIFGDPEGAIEFYDQALLRTSPNDSEERSWLTTKNARLQLASSNPKRAGELLEKAIVLTPESLFTWSTLAALKASQDNFADAIVLLRRRYESTPSATHLYDLSVMLEKAGRTQEAESAFQKFETKARAEMQNTFNANRDLVSYYADHQHQPAQALIIAAKEAETRHDCETLDVYAWALYRSGMFAEAKTQMDRALAPGVKDPAYLCHAHQIEAAVHDPTARASATPCPSSLQ